MKNHRLGMALLAILLVSLAGSSSYAQVSSAGVLFLRIAPGSRAAGMGEAFVAVADDATTTHWNPAGLGTYPLASKWLNAPIPAQYRPLRGIAPLKTGKGTDFEAYDIWAISDSDIVRYNNKGWEVYEVFHTKTDETVESKVRSYFEVTDETLLAEMVSKVAAANSQATYDEVTALRDRVLSAQAEKYRDMESVRNGLDSLVVSYQQCLIRWDRYEKLRSAVENGLADSMLTVGELEKINFAAQHALARFIPEDLKIPYSAFLRSGPTAIASGEKDLAVGTEDGLWYYNGLKWAHFGTESGLPSARITSLSHFGTTFLVGTEKGAAMLNGQVISTFNEAEGNPSGRVEAVRGLRVNDLYAVIDHDLYHFDGTNWLNWIPYTTVIDDSPLSIARRLTGSEDEAVISQYVGKLTAMNQPQSNDSASTPNVMSVAPGTDLRLPYTSGFAGDARTIFVDIHGYIWVGTEEGVYRFDGSKWSRPTNVPPAMGRIVGIEERDNDIYVATDQGLVVYGDGVWSRASIRGLGSAQMAALGHMNDEIWFVSEDHLVTRGRGRTELTGMHVNWLPELANDIYYEFLSFVHSTDRLGTFGANFTYITYGTLNRRSAGDVDLGNFTPSELAFTVSYGAPLTSKLAGGVSAKLIYSGLADQGAGNELGNGNATAFALDFGLLYKASPRLTFGAALTNIGPDITYVDAAQSDPLPINLAVGFSYKLLQSEYNRLLMTLEANKLMVGKNDGLSGEIKEVVLNGGAEFTYANLFSVRGGYIYDQVGQIKALTVGAGLSLLHRVKFDFAYVPSDQNAVALANTLRISASVQL